MPRTPRRSPTGLPTCRWWRGAPPSWRFELARAQEEAERAAAGAAEADGELSALVADEAAARAAVGTAVQSRDAARAAMDEARDAHRALSVEIATLEEMERSSALSAGEARAWLVEHVDEVLGLCEPLSHVIQASAGFEPLVESLLGGDVATLLVEDAGAVELIAGQLAAAGAAGEASFLIRDDASPSRIRGAARVRRERFGGAEGVPLVDELLFPEEARGAVEALLGDVVVCPTLEAALSAHGRDDAALRFATPDGAIVWPSGKVSVGGAVVDEGAGVLARVRHLEELRAQLSGAAAAQAKAEEAHRLAEEALRQAQATSLELSQALANLRGRAEAARNTASAAAEKLASCRRELESVERQRAEAEAAVASARPNVESFEARVKELDAALDAGKKKQEALSEELAPLRREAHRVSDSLAEAKLAQATLSERTTYAERVRDARVRDLETLAAASEEARVALRAKTVSAARIEPVLALIDELTASAQKWTRQLEEQATAAEDSSTGLHSSVTEARGRAHEAHALFDGVSERLSEARVQKGRLELQVEAAVNHIATDLSVPLETALSVPPLENRPEVEDALFKINRRIANLGTINPDAAEEYDALKVRYDYLAAQLERPRSRPALACEDQPRHRRAHEGGLRAHLRGGGSQLPGDLLHPVPRWQRKFVAGGSGRRGEHRRGGERPAQGQAHREDDALIRRREVAHGAGALVRGLPHPIHAVLHLGRGGGGTRRHESAPFGGLYRQPARRDPAHHDHPPAPHHGDG